ncbi:MAG: hypothetical protein QM708_12150 [Propioniciclava sp.]|uniref:hypothetical protein n=1 Tax=Propioniciclava sp. TaxID=2038686 RepID=UPI0039E52D5A
MSAQHALFDVPLAQARSSKSDGRRVDEAGLRRVAFCYTVTAAGTATGIRFGATVEDAMRWCSSPLSRGVLHGTEWIYCWTSAWNYVRHYRGDSGAYDTGHAYLLDIRGLRDNGLWDDRIASTGCKLFRLEDLPGLLRPMGVEVLADPCSFYTAARRPRLGAHR